MTDSHGIPKVAFLGIGLMGRPMAERLLTANYPLVAWNRTRKKAEALIGKGAMVADTPAAAFAEADVIITMLQDGRTVQDVLFSEMGALRPGTLVVDMSSTAHAESLEMHVRLSTAGVGFIDAPVSGGVGGAERGELAIMAGGSAADYARVETLLKVMGRPTLVGPAGCGQVAKLCNQLIVGATLAVVAEALMLAEAGGADAAAVRAAIRGGFAESRILEIHGQRMLDRDFMPGGQVKSQTKDLENVLAAANSVGLRLPVAELVTQGYRSILDVAPRADQSAALLALERLNPGHRLGTAMDKLP